MFRWIYDRKEAGSGSWGYTRIPVSDVEGVREALQELFGYRPPFEATDERGSGSLSCPTNMPDSVG
ncbi:hypothetical protein GCM10022226_00080 [Sphaerisporangium flaviroseum]|uniref:Uncharacterized protein n=1 Tax=Sphaerisporangium flaviroseum TaxID=509199 RepID=A0ABP7H941_9ACTN